MADIEYPQRWLKEHKAVTSPEGWRRPTTQELLKCQKGLEVEPTPEIKTVAITGLPTTESLVNGPTFAYTVDYTFTDAEYVPVNVQAVTTKTQAAVVTAVVNKATKKVAITITEPVVAEEVTVKVTIDGKTSNTLKLTFSA